MMRKFSEIRDAETRNLILNYFHDSPEFLEVEDSVTLFEFVSKFQYDLDGEDLTYEVIDSLDIKDSE